MDPIKGIENLLVAIKQLNDPSITLSICGVGDTQYALRLKQFAGQLGLFDRGVKFIGQVHGDLKTNAFLSSDVCILPSYSENFAMVVAKSLAHGVPVITSRETPWKSVESKQCGLWVDNTPESLAHAIKSIRKMELAEMGKKGWEWMNDEFGWDMIAKEMHALYLEMLK